MNSLPPTFLSLPLGDNDIPIEYIKERCLSGVYDFSHEDRFISWSILSGIFPTNPLKWGTIQEEHYRDYVSYIETFQLMGFENRPYDKKETDFGLDDNELMGQIHGDMTRTVRHIVFFPNPDRSKQNDDSECMAHYSMHIRRIERILYIFGKFNKVLGYTQGFNELVSPIFYVCASATSLFGGDWTRIEAETYYLFQQFFCATHLNELYTASRNSVFIIEKMNEFMRVMERHTPQIAKTINDLGIDPLCFALRWLNLLFAQDFQIPSLVVIWDSLFAHYQNLIEYTIYMAVAHISLLENNIRADNYELTLETLQKKSSFYMNFLPHIAEKFWKKDKR